MWNAAAAGGWHSWGGKSAQGRRTLPTETSLKLKTSQVPLEKTQTNKQTNTNNQPIRKKYAKKPPMLRVYVSRGWGSVLYLSLHSDTSSKSKAGMLVVSLQESKSAQESWFTWQSNILFLISEHLWVILPSLTFGKGICQ